MNPLIAATGLRAGYATGDVLQEVSIEVGTGEIVGVLGRNGVGKTTLMRALIGLLSVRSGSILYRGGDITRQPANRRAALGIGYVPQGREVFAHMSVLDNFRIGQFINRTREFQPDEVYGYFPFLRDRSRQQAGTLSGGSKKLWRSLAPWSPDRTCSCLTNRATVSSQAWCTTCVSFHRPPGRRATARRSHRRAEYRAHAARRTTGIRHGQGPRCRHAWKERAAQH